MWQDLVRGIIRCLIGGMCRCVCAVFWIRFGGAVRQGCLIGGVYG